MDLEGGYKGGNLGQASTPRIGGRVSTSGETARNGDAVGIEDTVDIAGILPIVYQSGVPLVVAIGPYILVLCWGGYNFQNFNSSLRRVFASRPPSSVNVEPLNVSQKTYLDFSTCRLESIKENRKVKIDINDINDDQIS
ncbi:hypothetical protein ACOSP7_010167 [Xanthoceras sorbifolium]